MGIFDKLFKKKEDKPVFPPRPEWKPDLPVDIDLIYEKSLFYTGRKIQLAVFKNGTVVIFPQPVEEIESSARQIIHDIFNYHVDFNPLEMDDGNYLIRYRLPAFTIVFKDEYEKNWNYIEQNHQKGICPEELLINSKGEGNVFNEVGKICLFGRTKLFMDALDPVIVKTFAPDVN